MSGLLRDMAMRADKPVTLNALLNTFGERSFGAAMLLLAAPNVVPGVAWVLGLPLIFITFQLTLGWTRPWLPQRFLDYALEAHTIKAIAQRLVPWLEWAETWLRPRGTLLTSSAGERLAGLACLVLSIILFMPIPGVNLLPTLGLCAFALGLIEQDANAMAVGWLLTFATFVILVLFGGLAFAALLAIIGW